MGSQELVRERIPGRGSPGAALEGLARRVRALPRRTVVGAAVLLQWLLVAALAARVRRDGWVFDPGDRPSGGVVSALPAIVLAQTLVLVPLVLALVHRLAERLAGRVFAAWAALVWVLLPYGGIAFADHSFRGTFADAFVVHLSGLAADPSLLALAAFLAAVVVALEAPRAGPAAAAAAAVAAAAGVAASPRAALVAVAPLAALALGGRLRAAALAAGLLGALLAGVAAAVHAGLLDGPFGSVSPLAAVNAADTLNETFWSARVLEWATFGGILALLRGRLPAAVGVAAASLAAFVSLDVPQPDSRSLTVALLHAALPAWFGVALGVAALPLLWPRPRPTPSPPTARETLTHAWERLRAPVRLRARTAERAGPVAMPLWAALALGSLFALMLFVGAWNAARYPLDLGYDAAAHMSYADQLIAHGTIPSQAEGGEYYTPPGYYAIAGAATWVGLHLGMKHPHYAAIYLNVLFVLATAALLLVLARLLFPRRPAVWVAAVGFFALLPVVAKTAAMFQPEPLNMLVSTAAITVSVRMLLRRDFSLRWLALVGALLGLGQLVRASSLFTLVAVAIAFLAALATGPVRRQLSPRKLGLAAAAVVVLVTPWYARQVLTYHQQPLYVNSNLTHQLFHPAPYPGGRRPAYFGIAVDDILNRPVRPFYVNEALSETYTEIWGDWEGHFAWSVYAAPSPQALTVLQNQSRIGILPTLLALGGWLGLVALAVRRRAERLALLPVVLLPAVALVAYLWRSYVQLEPTGNLFKASYLLTTAPLWALAFGVAVERLSRRRPFVAIALTAVFLVCGVLELQFMLYGVREHHLPL